MKLTPSEDGVGINVNFKNESYSTLRYYEVRQRGTVKKMIFGFKLGPGEKRKSENIASSIPWIITDVYDNIITIFEFPNVPVNDSTDKNDVSSESEDMDWGKVGGAGKKTTVSAILFGGAPRKTQNS